MGGDYPTQRAQSTQSEFLWAKPGSHALCDLSGLAEGIPLGLRSIPVADRRTAPAYRSNSAPGAAMSAMLWAMWTNCIRHS